MKIFVVAGDGIGPEITESTMAVMRTVDDIYTLGLDYEFDDVGFASLEKYGTTLRDETLAKARQCDGIILGPQSHLDYPPRDQGGVNVSAGFRVKLDLYANVRPARTRPGLARTDKHMDLVIMREATEGFYPDRNMVAGCGEFMPTEDIALSVRKITAFASNRIARRAFELAQTRRKKVAAIHKANNFILSDGLFLREVRKVAAEFPEVQVEEIIVDAMAAYLVRDCSRFDVVVATNFHADILSDLASELSGSLGLAGSINAGDDLAAAQAQHGSAPDIAGQNKANPISLILSAAMLLKWLGDRHKRQSYRDAAACIEKAIDTLILSPANRTPDLGGPLGTDAFTKCVVEEIQRVNAVTA
jgi:3-isopropylmalate dehydrogenase